MVDTEYSREDNIYYARLAEQGERYEDMINHMEAVAKVRFTDSKPSLLFYTKNINNLRKARNFF